MRFRGVDVHLFHLDPATYADRTVNPHLGASIGRYANRIAGASFSLDGTRYELVANDGPNHLHGGPDGWDRHEWTVVDETPASTTFGYRSPDGDAGYPGTVDATATFSVDGDALTIAYAATTDRPTVINLTNHGYWNLAGVGPSASAPIVDQVLTVAADRYLPVDDMGIPTGGLEVVDDTRFDLRAGERLAGVELDHCFAVDGPCRLEHPASGRSLEVATDQPGMQVDTGNHLHPPFEVHGSVSFEAQRFPDTPNRPALGSARLDPGQTYRSQTTYRFGLAQPHERSTEPGP